jgi:uncharacterized membrane protein YhaH (DUF805 family)
MKLNLSDLWRWNGNVSRAPFVVWATILFALKYNLDRLVLQLLFHRQWSVFSYFEQPFPGIQKLSPAQNPTEFVTLLAASLPFLWAGIILCLKRLRSARLPLWLTVLFVVPVLKWFLFVVLALVPERGSAGPLSKSSRGAFWLPNSVFASASLAVGASVLLAIVGAVLSTTVLREYGWGLFVGVPFCMGFIGSLIHGARQPRRLAESVLVALASVAIAGAGLLALAFEGVICLVMAAPLALVLAVMGAVAGHMIQSTRRAYVSPQLLCVPVLALPLMFASEKLRSGPAPLLEVVTAIEVNAAPEAVWKHVVEFTELSPPTEVLFKLGIAYPIRAEIRGRGPGAIRNCVFSTGPFVEPIEVWDEPRLLSFFVTSNPAPLQEWTPYHKIHPAHLNGFLVSDHGQFRLIPLPGGRTRLEGTTWYRHNMWPVRYWEIWSGQIIHAIHRRVLLHIKHLAEVGRR